MKSFVHQPTHHATNTYSPLATPLRTDVTELMDDVTFPFREKRLNLRELLPAFRTKIPGLCSVE